SRRASTLRDFCWTALSLELLLSTMSGNIYITRQLALPVQGGAAPFAQAAGEHRLDVPARGGAGRPWPPGTGSRPGSGRRRLEGPSLTPSHFPLSSFFCFSKNSKIFGIPVPTTSPCPAPGISTYSYVMFNSFILSTHRRVPSGRTSVSLSPCTTITGTFLILSRPVGWPNAAGAMGARPAQTSGYFVPRCQVPPPPIEWPIR